MSGGVRAPVKPQPATSSRPGIDHCPAFMALDPPRVAPVRMSSERPPRPSLGALRKFSVRSGSIQTSPACRTCCTREAAAGERGWPRSRRVTEACGSASHRRAASAQPAVPPPTMT